AGAEQAFADLLGWAGSQSCREAGNAERVSDLTVAVPHRHGIAEHAGVELVVADGEAFGPHRLEISEDLIGLGSGGRGEALMRTIEQLTDQIRMLEGEDRLGR